MRYVKSSALCAGVTIVHVQISPRATLRPNSAVGGRTFAVQINEHDPMTKHKKF